MSALKETSMTPKRTHLAVRLLPEEREQIMAAAAARGVSLTKFVRDAALLAALANGIPMPQDDPMTDAARLADDLGGWAAAEVRGVLDSGGERTGLRKEER